ncbi:HtrA protease/chaperone protein [Fulvivirga imtechensis AK7]|uniref:HtrA protease/chaperone protein n=1 Tax=Fulvivirga imtechensis AK7 TaxID=1237149 RepID=L8JSI1_9BACT|nr:trypsin-like peptidase domain-containing protein [Fulvivirga imtechensis]ELR71795.1 HtrA protease/chaperone protein [Fulvivirga imtechensis AK7]
MSRRQFFFGIFLSSVLAALFSSTIIFYYLNNNPSNNYNSITERQRQVAFTNYPDSNNVVVPKGLNFIYAANEVISGVVHIRALYSSGQYSINPLEGAFRGPSQSSGSGVIVSDDGYIVTNNHVIENASQIEVILNDNRTYAAKIIGTDPTTDLALLKVEEVNLDFVRYGNSDKVMPGEWVLAIGNPFDLNSTVTAGIISAKARNIGILRDKNNLQIESFIQTDAAVNPGNSGGALVNLNGELIGINTAIATPSGSYAGYSFAVPVSLVKKVVDDLLEFGTVQRGLLGIRIGDVNSNLAQAQGLSVVSGVFVSYVNKNSSAEEAGILPGDVIVAINQAKVTNVSELQEQVARNRPGDKIQVTYLRNGNKNVVDAILRNTEGTTEIVSKEYRFEIEGAEFDNLNVEELSHLELQGGVKIISVTEGKWLEAGIKEGFIITKIDKVTVTSIKDLNNILTNKNGGMLVEGIYPNGESGVFGINW